MNIDPNNPANNQGANAQAGAGPGAPGAGSQPGYGPGPSYGGHMFDPMQMMMIMAAMQGARQGPQQPMVGPAACFSPMMMPGAWTGFPWAWMIWWAWWWSWLVWPGFLPGGGGLPPMPGNMQNMMGQFAFTRADFWYHCFEAMKAIWQQAANSTGFANPFAPGAKPIERTDPAKLRKALERDFPDAEQRERIVCAVQCAEMMTSMFPFARR